MKKKVVRASLRLFNAIPVGGTTKFKVSKQYTLERGLQHGYILSPDVPTSNELLDVIDNVVGISGVKANAAFHKSWAVVRDSAMEVLITQQIIHYMTTYGFEALGIYHESTVYIPNEILDLPKLTGKLPLTVIKAFTAPDMLNSIIKLSESGIALHEDTLNDVMTIVENTKAFDQSEWVDLVENRELKARLMDHYGLVPTEPVEFLRHLISKLTDESLVIKNKELIDKIKGGSAKHLDDMMEQAPDDLAAIFLRYKPLFLAMRSISRKKTVFNRLRKQAVKMHKPLPEDYLNNVTGRLKNGTLSLKTLTKKLEGATIFRKVRLAYALQYRLHPCESIVYQVRNGRGWASEFGWGVEKTMTSTALGYVKSSLILDLSNNVHGKQIYIPEGIKYAVPATEKQFTGHIPSGSYVSVPKDMVLGVYWENLKADSGWDRGRIDLDLASMSVSGKIGWDSSYRSSRRNAMFSGDVTDAPNGATELFYFSGSDPYEANMLTLNYYNFHEDMPVPMKLFVASEELRNMDRYSNRNYMVDPNNIICSSNLTIDKKQNILGLYMHVGGEGRFYFHHTAVGNAITSRTGNENITRTREYLESKMANPIVLNDLLVMAGAAIITTPPEEGEFIDLSPEALTKNSFIDLMISE